MRSYVCLYVLQNLYERFYVLQNLHVQKYVCSSVLQNLYVSSYVRLYVFPNLYCSLYALPNFCVNEERKEKEKFYCTTLYYTTDPILPDLGTAELSGLWPPPHNKQSRGFSDWNPRSILDSKALCQQLQFTYTTTLL